MNCKGKKTHMEAQLKPSTSGLANVKNPVIGRPPAEVLTSSANKDWIGLSASDDKVCKLSKLRK